MKIMSFNTQHCRNFMEDKIDFDLIADTIRKFDCDIVGLNEIRGEGVHPEYTAQVETLKEKTGYPYCFFAKAIDIPGGGPYGNGFLSKIPMKSVEVIPLPIPEVKKYNGYYEPRCILKAVLEGGYTILIAHFGLNHDEQEFAIENAIKNLSPDKCILMGDFNLRPDNELLNPLREIMTDTADFFEQPLLSFPSDNPVKKIDYIFVSRDLKVKSADIPAIIASDHRPHIAEIE